MDAARRITGIFAKCPRPGAVKTRLSPPLEPAQAACVAEAMLEDALRRARLARESYTSVLCFAPPEERAWFETRVPRGIPLVPQVGIDLGQRLSHFFTHFLSSGGNTAVALGTDAPLITLGEVARAHELLETTSDCVVGPDLGGGYWLFGLKRPHPELFDAELMRQPSMVDLTLDRARALALRCTLLSTHPDVDHYHDLLALRPQLASLPPNPPADFPSSLAALLSSALLDPPHSP